MFFGPVSLFIFLNCWDGPLFGLFVCMWMNLNMVRYLWSSKVGAGISGIQSF